MILLIYMCHFLILCTVQLQWYNTFSSLTMADSNSFWVPGNSTDSSRKQILRNIFGKMCYFIKNMYFVCSHKIASTGWFQWLHSSYHYFIECSKTLLNCHHLHLDLALWLTLNVSNYPFLEQIDIVPKMIEPLKFDCISVKCNAVNRPGPDVVKPFSCSTHLGMKFLLINVNNCKFFLAKYSWITNISLIINIKNMPIHIISREIFYSSAESNARQVF